MMEIKQSEKTDFGGHFCRWKITANMVYITHTVYMYHGTIFFPFHLRGKNNVTKGGRLSSLMDAVVCNGSSWNIHTKKLTWYFIQKSIQIWGNMTKWRATKTTIEQTKKTTNQSEVIVLAAVYTSHQVWCLQRLSERAVQKLH